MTVEELAPGPRRPRRCGRRRGGRAGRPGSSIGSSRPGQRQAAAPSRIASGSMRSKPSPPGALGGPHGEAQVHRLVSAEQGDLQIVACGPASRAGPAGPSSLRARPPRSAPRPRRSGGRRRSRAATVRDATPRPRAPRSRPAPAGPDGGCRPSRGRWRRGCPPGTPGDRGRSGVISERMGSAEVGGVEPAAEAHLDHGEVHLLLGEPAEGGEGHRLEVGGRRAGLALGEVDEVRRAAARSGSDAIARPSIRSRSSTLSR